MAKLRTVEQHLAAIRKVDGSPASSATLDVLRDALRFDKPGSGIAIAAAAKTIAEHNLDALVAEMIDAFERLLAGGAKSDPTCRGKIAIAKALHAMDHWDDRVFGVGVRVEQLEGFAPEDTAAELRAMCGLAHAHFARADVLDVLADLLADDWRYARLGAANAIGDAGHPDATIVLRYIVLAGTETEPDVLSAIFESLLALDREPSIRFAISRLAAHDDVAEAAALALGTAREVSAVDALARWANDCRPEQRHRVGYLVLALLRCDRGNELLLDAIATRGKADAIAAVNALATFRDDAATIAVLREVLAKVTDKQVRAAIEDLL